MKRFSLVLLIVATFLVINSIVKAQPSYKLKSSKITIQGTSSLHDWESQVTDISVMGNFEIEGKQVTQIENVEAKILVEGIKSTKGKIMDNKTYEAFQYKKFPKIIFTSSSFKPKSTATAIVDGNLTMAGVTRPISLDVKHIVLANGDIQFQASEKIKMTDYNMEPPTAMMGSIKVGDEVNILFDIVLTQINTNNNSLTSKH